MTDSNPRKGKQGKDPRNSSPSVSAVSDFVSEQPGLGLSFIGLFVAFFLGLSVRAVTAPDRIQALVQKSTESIHKDTQIHFEKAYVSLSRGIFPDLSVVVEDIEIQSQKSCWFTPLAEIHQIRLPLSFQHLLQGQILIHEVIADEVNLSLRSEMKPCESSGEGASEISTTALPVAESNPAAVTASEESLPESVVARLENVRRANPIDRFQVGVLKIHYLPVAFTSVEIQNFKAQLLSESPRLIEMTGKLNLGGETNLGDVGSHADLKVDFLEGDEPKVSALAQGLWREGDYRFAADLNLKSKNFKLQTDIHHLPISQVIPVLKKYKLMQSEFNGRQAWLSGHLQTEGPLDRILKTPAHLTGLQLEGDLGEISLAKVEIKSWQPLSFDPIDFQIHGLNVKELLVFLNRPHPTPALGALGTFNGTAHFVNPEQLSLRGDYSGLEFIFSNRGIRQSQILSMMSGELSLNQKKWSIQIDRVKPNDGIFDGAIQISADKDFKDLNVQAKIDELTLSPQVQSLMTGGGSFGAVQGQIQTHLRQAEILELKGQIKSDQMLIEGLRVSKPKISFETARNEIRINLTTPEIEWPKGSPMTSTLLAPVLEKLPVVDGGISLKALSVQLKTEKFVSLSWSHLQAQVNRESLKSQGGWNAEAEMFGEISLSGKPGHRWEIQGNRNSPVLVQK
jgi:hypothetical protein